MNRSAMALGAGVIALAFPAGSAAAAPQLVQESVAAVQATAVQVGAPVRVLSDGDGQTSATPVATGAQTASRSVGVVQTGPVQVNAPVRVLSDGDNAAQSTPGAGAGGAQSATRSIGAAQLGQAQVDAPCGSCDGDNAARQPGGAGERSPRPARSAPRSSVTYGPMRPCGS